VVVGRELVAQVAERTARLSGATARGLALDLEVAQPAVNVVADAYLEAQAFAAPMIVKEIETGGVQILRQIHGRGVLSGIEHAIVSSELSEELRKHLSRQQVFGVRSLQQVAFCEQLR
jgi:hypothetical protein